MLLVLITMAVARCPLSAKAVSIEEHTLHIPFTSSLELRTLGGNIYLTGASSTLTQISPTGSATPVPNTSNVNSGVTVGSDGHLWWLGTAAVPVEGRDHEFPALYEQTPTGPALRLRMPFETWQGPLEDMALGPDGALWITRPLASGGAIVRYGPGGAVATYPLAVFPNYPLAITGGPDGALWFTDALYDAIGRITTGGEITEWPIRPFADVYDLTVGPDNAIWFTEQNAARIGRITVSGQVSEFSIPVSGSQPRNLVAGQDGAVWFTDPGVDAVGRITLNGVVTEYPLLTPEEVPDGITTATDGTLWISEDDPPKVARVNPAGQPAQIGKAALSSQVKTKPVRKRGGPSCRKLRVHDRRSHRRSCFRTLSGQGHSVRLPAGRRRRAR
jgi:streptogramin lyase